MSKKRKALGMGLDGLLGDDIAANVDFDAQQAANPPGNNPTEIPLAAIQAGKYQPRNQFDEQSLRTLADSIKEHGVLQPIVVRALTKSAPGTAATHEIIAGERRFRAAALAGLTAIPAIIREVGNEQALAMALIENIQREDLNPLEEARAIKQLIDEFDYTHESAANAIGRSRSATTNTLRLLNLSAPIQQMLIDRELDMGHARALVVLSRADQLMLAHRIIERQLTTRETEQEVTAHLANLNSGDSPAGKSRKLPTGRPDRDLMRLQDELSNILAAPVTIKSNTKGRGKLVVQFSSNDQFEGLLEQLGLRAKLDM